MNNKRRPLLRATLATALFSLVALANTSRAAQWDRDVVFAKRGMQELKLDIVRPDKGARRPAVICIHGGAWLSGKRSAYHRPMELLAGSGVVALTIDYRLTDVAQWPAQLEDVQAALAWLVEHADEYGVDVERIGVIGDSAGGHLALMLAAQAGASSNQLRIRAVVNFYGPTDLRDIEKIEPARDPVERLVGGKLEERLNVLKQLSPITYIDRTDPPVLTFHGDKDNLVPIGQAEVLHEALDGAKTPNRFVRMKGVGHGLGGDVEAHLREMRDFLTAYIKQPALNYVTHEDFDGDAARWEPTDAAAWRLVKSKGRHGRSYYSLHKKRSDYQPAVRSPLNISWLKDAPVGDFVLEVDARSTHKPYGHQDLCLFFGRQDASHFYYVHIGRQADAHANSIFLVNGEPRVSIAATRTDGTDWSRGWHRIRIRREVSTGLIEVYFDDMRKPVMRATDKTFGVGRIGIGSFDDTGDFDALRLWRP
ncbi:MAG: alpha/beta hydrolase [Pirellulaceae bacterium]|jgi:acetyl esterase/lipase|nr:alpha/beta hydrolase [Pirellulaceae bacterium]